MPQPVLFYPDGTPIPPAALPQAYADGAVRVQDGDSVLMRDDSGNVRRVDAGEFAQARQMGFSLLGHDEVAARDKEEKYGSLAQQALTGVETGAKGLSLGLSDWAGEKVLGPEWAAETTARREVNPMIALGGELAGAVAPALLGGGSGLVGTAMRMTPGGIVGHIAGHAGVKAAGLLRSAGVAGESALARAALTGVNLGTSGALEGALYGAGTAASKAALEQTDLTAEKLLSGAWHGIEWGGGSGAALGVAGSLARSAGKLAAPALQKLDDLKFSSAAESLNVKSTLKSLGFQGSDVRALTAAKSAPEQAAKLDRLERMVKRVHDEGLINVTDSVQARAAKIADAADDAGKQIGAIRKQLDAENVAAADPIALMRRIRDEVIAPLKATPAEAEINQKIVASVEKYALKPLQKQVDSGERLGFEALARIRKKLDDKAYQWARKKTKADADQFASSARIMEDETEKAIAKNASQDMAQAYLGAKTRYSDLITLGSKASERAGMDTGNRFFSLTDNMFASGGVMMGLMQGNLPVAAAQGLVLGFANRMLRNYGTPAVAKITRKLADYNARKANAVEAVVGNMAPHAARKARHHMHNADALPEAASAARVSGETAAVEATKDTPPDKLRKAGAALAAVGSAHVEREALPRAADNRKTDELRNAYHAVVTRARYAQQDPGAYSERLADRMGPLLETEPQLAEAMITQSIADQMFLASKIPAAFERQNTLTPHLEQPELSRHDAEKLVRYAEALEDPLSVVEDLARNEVNLEGIEALKARRPLVYAEIRGDVAMAAAKLGHALPFSRRVSIGVAFELPTDQALTPEYARGLQQVYADQAKQSEEPPRPPSGAGSQATSKLAESSMTPSQRIALGA